MSEMCQQQTSRRLTPHVLPIAARGSVPVEAFGPGYASFNQEASQIQRQKRASQWCAGDLHQPLKRLTQLQDQVNRPGSRQRCRLGHGGNCRSLCKHRSSIVNQALQPVGCHIQCRVIHRALVSRSGFGALFFENVVNFFFDI